MKKTMFLLTVLLSVSAYAQKTETEVKVDSNLELNAQLAQPHYDLLSPKPTFTAQSIALLDESGEQVNVITPEMLKDMQLAGKVPTIKIGNVVFVVQAPVDPRTAYPGPQE